MSSLVMKKKKEIAQMVFLTSGIKCLKKTRFFQNVKMGAFRLWSGPVFL